MSVNDTTTHECILIMDYWIYKFKVLKTILIPLKYKLTTFYEVHLLKLTVKFNFQITSTDKCSLLSSSMFTSMKLCRFQTLVDFRHSSVIKFKIVLAFIIIFIRYLHNFKSLLLQTLGFITNSIWRISSDKLITVADPDFDVKCPFWRKSMTF